MADYEENHNDYFEENSSIASDESESDLEEDELLGDIKEEEKKEKEEGEDDDEDDLNEEVEEEVEEPKIKKYNWKPKVYPIMSIYEYTVLITGLTQMIENNKAFIPKGYEEKYLEGTNGMSREIAIRWVNDYKINHLPLKIIRESNTKYGIYKQNILPEKLEYYGPKFN